MLRHQLAVLRRNADKPQLTNDDRTLLGTIAASLPALDGPVGSSPPRPCCAGTDVASPDTGPNPTGAWTTQAARNLFLRHADRLTDARALVRDRGSQFIDAFDEIFRTEGLKILKTPVRTPVANTFAERWIGTLRRELLDRTIIWNQRQLERLVIDYIDHYNTHRPHRSLDQRPPRPADPDDAARPLHHRSESSKSSRCDGLINEYRNAA